jgi:hypothetical protein
MSIFNTSMFDSIKDALAKETTTNRYENIMKFAPGNSYTVRLLPNVKAPQDTFFHYYSHAWESFATGQFMNYLSPTTWGDKDPIAEMRFRVYHHGTEEEKEKAKAVIRRENWLVNAYIVNDPVNADNNGKIKIIRFGRQLHKIIMEAIQGEDAEEFGAKIFDLSPDGCNFRIKVDRQSSFPTYVSSKFLMPSKIKGLAEGDYDSMYESIFKLDEIFKVRSYDELDKALNEHYYEGDAPVAAATAPLQESVKDDDDDDDGIPMDFDKEPSKESDSKSTDDDPITDDKINELLQGLDA